ncbi:phage tail assembly chaperone [Phenylobacterium sp. VNQ135]|uniref:phage tail assembly chaperone n=1 Tax=Phenylobacterium sp. VNQ135 TaxID=3400922 RepID=UPI003BFDA359
MIAFAGAVQRKKKPDPLPPFPDELDWLWGQYLRLSRRRQSGMGANPISYSEIEAYERKALVTFTAWESDLLMRVDDAVLDALAGEARKSPPSDKSEPVPVSDTNSVKAIFRGLATQKRVEKEAKSRDT